MTIKKYIIIEVTVILFFTILNGYSQTESKTSKLFTEKQLKEDFSCWRNFVEKKHPLLYLYNSKEYLDRCFDSVYISLNHSMNEQDFFTRIAPVVALVKDGHNVIKPSKSRINEIVESDDFFPIKVYNINNELFVRYNYSTNDTLKAGDVITHINGEPVNLIINEITNCIQRDGNNLQLPIAILNNDFEVYYHFLYGFSSNYTFDFISSKGAKSQIKLNGCNFKKTKNLSSDKSKIVCTKNGKVIELSFIDSIKTALLDIKSFEKRRYKNVKQGKFRKIISGYFKEINKSNVQNLIIDVRFNGGGNPVIVSHVLKYLFDKKFFTNESRITNHPKETDYFKRTRKDWFELVGGWVKPKRNNYKGNIYVLTNEASFSGAVAFSSILQKNNRAFFIGAETGGNPIIMGGANLKNPHRILPNTKIDVTTSTTSCLLNDISKNTGRGLIPNVIIDYTKEDVISHYDKCLDYTIKLIRKSNIH